MGKIKPPKSKNTSTEPNNGPSPDTEDNNPSHDLLGEGYTFFTARVCPKCKTKYPCPTSLVDYTPRCPECGEG